MAISYGFRPAKGQTAYQARATPTTAQTYAATGAPHWDKGTGWEQMSSGSTYGKGLSEDQKLYAIRSLTGKDFDPFSGSGQYSKLNGTSPSQKFAGLFDTDSQGARYLKANTRTGGVWGAKGTDNATLAEQYRMQMLDQAYDSALNDLYADRDLSDDEVKAGDLQSDLKGDHGKDGKWVERTNRLTGEKGYAPVKTKDAKYGSNFMSNSWRKEKDDWIEGAGAVGGVLATVLTGNPLLGLGVYGAAKDQSDKTAEKMEEKKYQQRFKTGDGTNAGASGGAGAAAAAAYARRLRDVARSRAAGAGTFNYTEQVEG